MEEFQFNPDHERRDFLLGLAGEWTEALGGVKSFEFIELDILEILFKERFIDPKDTQNFSPTMQQFLDFMKQYPDVLAHGYAVSPEREDYRVTIEGLWAPEDYVTPELKEAFIEFCGGADALATERDLYSWWD